VSSSWLNPFGRLPRWPNTVKQPLENPTQTDRLPSSSGVELEYPSQRYTHAQDRTHTTRWFLGFAAASLMTAVSGSIIKLYLFPLFAIAAFYLFVVNDLGRAKRPRRWFVYLGVGPLVFIALYTFRDPFVYLLLGVAAGVRLADLFASHYFHLKTTAPLPRTRADGLRSLWSQRGRRVFSPAKGLELYALAAVIIASVLSWVFATETARSYEGVLDRDASFPKLVLYAFSSRDHLVRLPTILAGLLALFVFPWLSERLIAFLFHRRPVGYRMMVRAFGEAVIAWCSYNRHGATAVGVFQSPSGSHAQRRRMTLATVLLFVCFFAQLSDRERLLWDRLNRSLPPDGVPGDAGRDARPEFPVFDPSGSGVGASSGPRPGPSIRLVSFRPDEGAEGLPPLQKWEQDYLGRLRPADREEFLERRRLKHADAAKAESEANRQLEAEARVRPPAFQYLKNVTLAAMTVADVAVFPFLFAFVPPLYVLACCFTTSARVAGFWCQEFKTESGRKLLNTESWDDLVNRVRRSGDPVEKESLLLGVNAWDDTPVIVPRDVFREHAHILGDSGSGKTSLGIASLLTQFVRFRDCSVVIIDLKGDDLALFEGARIEAERAGLKFRWFTNELDKPSHIFNPLTQSHLPRLTPYQRTDVLTSALGLQYGSDYGRGFFSDANAEMLFYAMKFRSEGVSSFKELSEVLGMKAPFLKMDKELKKAGSHLQAMITRLADCEPLNATGKGPYSEEALANAIDMPDVFRTPQVLYFHLSSAIGTASTAEMARLAIYSLLTAAKTTPAGERGQVYLFIDEFQRIVANNLELILQQARSMNIGAILANQTLGDLKTAGVDLLPTVRANTRFRQFFAASDLAEQEEIIKTSGETTVYTSSLSRYVGSVLGASANLSLSETVTPRLRVNDVLLATDHPQQSIVYIRRGKGYAQFGGMPFVMTSAFHISQAEYEERKHAAWPDGGGETITPTLAKAPERAGVPEPTAETRSASPLLGPAEVVSADAKPPEPTPSPRAPTEPSAAPATIHEQRLAAMAKFQEDRKRAKTRPKKKKGETREPDAPAPEPGPQ